MKTLGAPGSVHLGSSPAVATRSRGPTGKWHRSRGGSSAGRIFAGGEPLAARGTPTCPPRVEPHVQDKKKGQGRSGVSSAAVMADAAVRLVGIVPISAKAWRGGDMHAFPKP
jgi:hypothetical protein